MKCKECEKAGTKSKIFERGGSSTLMYFHNTRFYDEDGVWHSHEPNQTSCSFECSNGHKWNEKLKNKCPNCDWEG